MERKQAQESLWLWLGGLPFVISIFIIDPVTAGLFVSLAVASIAGAVVLSLGLMKIVLGGVSRARQSAGMQNMVTVSPLKVPFVPDPSTAR